MVVARGCCWDLAPLCWDIYVMKKQDVLFWVISCYRNGRDRCAI